MYLLALDCSTSRGSVALGWRASNEPPVIYWHEEFPAGRGCGGKLFTALEEAISIVRDGTASGEPFGRLEGIIVGLGPGSYSGVRQAIAAANGLAAATGAWVRGVPSAAILGAAHGSFQVIGDARRGTFYHTAVSAKGVCVSGPELLESVAALEARLAERPDWPVRVVEIPLPSGLLCHAAVCLPDASLLFYVDDPLRPPPLEPIYLRPVSITLPNAAKPPVP